MPRQLLQREGFTSVQAAQAGLAKLLLRAERLGLFYRLLKNNKPIGVLLTNKAWEEIIEDLAALASPAYLQNIKTARRQRGRVSSKRARKLLGL